ncbi:hypothetical protein HMPREF1869_00965 [Bacteroidales bacterium KA00251]|nr:hypothetical protein HMPREF1869_00965 [Bacteroidales bacterium KA00251]
MLAVSPASIYPFFRKALLIECFCFILRSFNQPLLESDTLHSFRKSKHFV